MEKLRFILLVIAITAGIVSCSSSSDPDGAGPEPHVSISEHKAPEAEQKEPYIPATLAPLAEFEDMGNVTQIGSSERGGYRIVLSSGWRIDSGVFMGKEEMRIGDRIELFTIRFGNEYVHRYICVVGLEAGPTQCLLVHNLRRIPTSTEDQEVQEKGEN